MAEFTYSSADVANALAQVTGGTGIDQWRSRLGLGELERAHGLPTGTLSAVMRSESNGDPYATSKRGAKGLFQFMDKTAQGYNIDPFDPEQAAPAAAKELGSLYKKYGGDVDNTLAAWNWGQGNLDTHGMENAPAETRGFMAKVGRAITPASAEAAEAPARGRQAGGFTYTSTDVDAIMQQLGGGGSAIAPASAEAADASPPRAGKGARQSAASGQAGGFTYTSQDVDAIMQQLSGGQGAAPRAAPPPSAPMQVESSLNPFRKTTDLTIAIEKQTPDAQYPARPVALTQLTPEMDDDEILERLGYDPAEVKKSKLYKPGNLRAHITDPNSTFGQLADTPLGGFMRGARDPIDALVQLGSRGLGKVGILSSADVSYLDALTKIGEADYQQNWRRGKKVDPETGEGGMFSDPSRLLGEAGITAGIPMGRATTLARTAGRGALMGGGLAAAQPVFTGGAPGTQGDTFWEQKASQIGTGAVFGGVLSPALEKGVVPAVTKGANWMRGRGVPAEAQRRLDLGERFGVRLGYPDVAESRLPGQVSMAAENVPLSGFGAFRTAQHDDTRRAVTRYQGDLQAALRSTPWRDLGQVRAAAARGGRLGAEARGLLDEIAAVGNDPHRTIQASSKLNLFHDRLQSERNYSRVDRLAKPLGNMQPTRAIQSLDDLIAQAERDPLPSAEVKREVLGALQRVRGEISATAAQPQPSMGVRNPLTGSLQAQPVTERTNLPDTSYSRMRSLRSDLGTLQRDASTPAVARAMGDVKSALEDDMRDFARKSGVPELVKAQRYADRFHYKRVIRYRGQALAKAAEKDLPDEISSKFMRQGRDRAQYFYRGLDPKGQAAVRASMVDEAYQKATANRQPGTFDAGAFAGEMQRHQRATNVFFRGQDRDSLTGFTEVMQLAKRGGEYVDKPPGSIVGLGVGAAGLGLGALSLPILAKVLTTTQGLRALWLTQAGRNFLLTSSRVDAASPRWQRAMQRFLREAGRTGGLAGAELDKQGALQAERNQRELEQ